MRARLLALALLLLPLVPAAAQPMEIPPGKWWKKPRIVDTLKLTADQQDRLEKIFAKNRRDFIELRANVERRLLDFEELMSRKDSDPKKVTAAAEALEEAKHRLGKARTMMVVEMREVLREEQWQKLLDGMEQWRAERREQFRQGRRGQGRPPAAQEANPDDQ